MRHGSLFSGIGGFDLAAQWMGWENVFQVEWDGFCQKVLAKNFPNVKRYGDIKEFDGTEYRGRVDIISGGFPCQPFSHAGKRKGTSDDRYLWPEMLRVISEVKPAFVVGENVAGLVSMENGKTLDRILSDLADEGYQTEQFIIPACALGAWHRRERIWIIAQDSQQFRCNGNKWKSKSNNGRFGKSCTGDIQRFCREKNVSDSSCKRLPDSTRTKFTSIREAKGTLKRGEFSGAITTGREYWSVEPLLGRVANGIPNRVDRLKGLGNAIVPQVAFEIFKAIEQLQH